MSTTNPCGPLRFRDPLPGGALAVMRDALPATYDRGMERMNVPLDTARDGGKVRVSEYGFAGYERFYGKPPASPLSARPRQDVTEPLTVRVSFTREDGAAPEHVDVPIPVGHPAGRAVTVPIPGSAADVTDRLRLVDLAPSPPPVPSGPSPGKSPHCSGTWPNCSGSSARNTRPSPITSGT